MRSLTARHPNISVNLLKKLSLDSYEDVISVAESKNINLEIIKLLINDPSKAVRTTTISNHHLQI